jgi:dolichol-phosphate mannosyltransferase
MMPVMLGSQAGGVPPDASARPGGDGGGPAGQRVAANLSVVFSFRNEEAVLRELIRRTRVVLRQEVACGILTGYELIFVNDASTDRSLEILLAANREHGDVRILNTSRQFGVTPCVLAGMRHASGDAVVYLDADLQDPPELIPDLLRRWLNDPGLDVVHTVRRSRAGESRLKLYLTWLGYKILGGLSSVAIRREAGDFKLLSRRAVDHILRFRETRPFLRGLVSWIGFRQAEVYYDRDPRFAGKTKFPVLGPGVIRNFFESALISFSGMPLQLATILGLLVSLLAFLLLGYVLVEKALGHNIPGWSALMVTTLFLGGMQLLTFGVMGLYIHSIHLEIKQRPNYILEGKVGFPPLPEDPGPQGHGSCDQEPRHQSATFR